jgi:hypothetical protein
LQTCVFFTIFLIYFLSAAVILLAYLALNVQFSLLYNRAARGSVLCCFIPVCVVTGDCCFQIVMQFLINFHFLFHKMSNYLRS